MTLLLADLRYPEEIDAIRQRLLTNLGSAGAPVDDWIPAASGGVEMIRVDADATALQRLLATKVALLANLMLLELAEGDSLTLLAQKRYGIIRDPETKTIQSMALWLVGTASAQPFSPGDLVVAGVTGNRYRLLDDIQIQQSNTEAAPLFAHFDAELAGNSYADAAETIRSLVTAVAGLRCSNRRSSDFLPVKVSGSSTGTVQAFFAVAGVPPTFDSLRIRVDTDGEIGTATYSYSTDGGGTWTNGGPIPTGLNIIVAGVSVAFSNGTAPSFLRGDIFTLLVAQAIVQRGADAESDASLRGRCRLRWMTLSDVPLEGTIDLWAHLASPEVDKVMADADPNTPGSVLVTIASTSGPASGAVVLAVQDYISARLFGYRGMPAASGFFSPEEKVLVRSATALSILAGGTVSVPRASIQAVQTAAETAWLAYLRGVPLGGQPGAIVRVTELVQAVMDAGAVDIQGATLNGSASNITLADQQVAVPATGFTLLNSLIWQPV